jgi:type II secretory pathway pseudopilin PulG
MNMKRQSGFTLIEAIVYLALFAIMFSGIVTAACCIMETSGKNQARAMMQEEGEFLTAKINLAVFNAKSTYINSPDVITMTAWNGATSTIAAIEGNLIHVAAGAEPVMLNNSNTRIDGLDFKIVDPAAAAAGIEYHFNLASLVPAGMKLVSKFGSTAYFRK